MKGISNGAAVQLNDNSHYLAHNLIMTFAVPMALKATVNLGIPDILAAAESKKPLSAAEILAQLPTKTTPGRQSISNLRRLLNPLVREGVFRESLNSNNEPVYGLTELGKWFITGNETNLLDTLHLNFRPEIVAAWNSLHEVILDETTTPFEKANGLPVYEYIHKKGPEFGAQMQSSMTTYNKLVSREVIDHFRQSGVVDGVTTLVDVGGGHGSFVGEVVAHFPHIQGVNLDMQNIIATAPSIKGVQHIAGNFFETVPSGDAMILKFIVHNYGDKQATEILKNCLTALPENGKVILVENTINEHPDQSILDTHAGNVDLLMLLNLEGARERTQEEYQEILKAAGFSRSTLLRKTGSPLGFIVGFKV